MKSPEIVLTEDGSHTLRNAELNEHYHSTHGAIQESNHIFIQNGLIPYLAKNNYLRILEIGFGTGLNAYLSLLEINNRKQVIHYTALETFPIGLETAKYLNYSELLVNKKVDALFDSLHSCAWEKEFSVRENFQLLKLNCKLEALSMNDHVDLIYFDAFSPDVQPELWTAEIFKKLYFYLNLGGSLVTYCAKGQVKRNLKNAGFTVISKPGPPGKREITLALKHED